MITPVAPVDVVITPTAYVCGTSSTGASWSAAAGSMSGWAAGLTCVKGLFTLKSDVSFGGYASESPEKD